VATHIQPALAKVVVLQRLSGALICVALQRFWVRSILSP